MEGHLDTIADLNEIIRRGDFPQQVYTDLDGNEKLLVSGVTVPALGSVTLSWVPGTPDGASAFKAEGNTLETDTAG